MTDVQYSALQTIKMIRDKNHLLLLRAYPGCTPTDRVSAIQLMQFHKIRSSTIQALIRQGYLEEFPSDGFGPVVRVTEKVEDYIT